MGHAQNKQQGKGTPTTPLIKTNPKQWLVKPLLGPLGQPHLCFSSHDKIIKQAFRNTAYSKAMRFHFTMQYQ